MTTPQLEIALPVLMRHQREQGPFRPLEELLAVMVSAAQRRGLVELLARVQREAAPSGAALLTDVASALPVEEHDRDRG